MNELEKNIFELREKGYSHSQIAKELNISINSVKHRFSKKFKKTLELRKEKEETEKEFERRVVELVPQCNSLNHICTSLGIRGVSHYYDKIKTIIKKHNLDTSHFGTLVFINRNTDIIDDKDFFINGIKRHGKRILERLIKDHHREYKCECCGISEWNGKQIVLQIHHIDGNHENNEIDNLQILCPNCHTQTDTYAKSNASKRIIKSLNRHMDEAKISKGVEKKTIKREDKFCPICGKKIKHDKKYCSHECAQIASRKTNRPSKEELVDLLKTNSKSAIGRMFNVSETAVRKWIKYYNI